MGIVMPFVLFFILAQQQFLGGWGPHVLTALAGSLGGGALVAWINAKSQKVLASDAWVRGQFAEFVQEQRAENRRKDETNRNQQTQIDELELRIGILTTELAAEKGALITCRSNCERLRKERDECRDSHRGMYDENEKLRAELERLRPKEPP
jgi:chromosome segregation ATPase